MTSCLGFIFLYELPPAICIELQLCSPGRNSCLPAGTGAKLSSMIHLSEHTVFQSIFTFWPITENIGWTALTTASYALIHKIMNIMDNKTFLFNSCSGLITVDQLCNVQEGVVGRRILPPGYEAIWFRDGNVGGFRFLLSWESVRHLERPLGDVRLKCGRANPLLWAYVEGHQPVFPICQLKIKHKRGNIKMKYHLKK